MSQSLSRVYVHITFSTKYRKELINPGIEKPLYEYLGGICKGMECYPAKIGGHKNHVHILCLLSKKVTQMELLEELKKRSSKWIKSKGQAYADFYWQNGYGIFSVNPAETDRVIKYIENQHDHHRKKDFKKEFLELLNKYNVNYDEKYLWD